MRLVACELRVLNLSLTAAGIEFSACGADGAQAYSSAFNPGFAATRIRDRTARRPAVESLASVCRSGCGTQSTE